MGCDFRVGVGMVLGPDVGLEVQALGFALGLGPRRSSASMAGVGIFKVEHLGGFFGSILLPGIPSSKRNLAPAVQPHAGAASS